jgi:hypothetical protein
VRATGLLPSNAPASCGSWHTGFRQHLRNSHGVGVPNHWIPASPIH